MGQTASTSFGCQHFGTDSSSGLWYHRHAAASYGHLDVLSWLLAHGGDINIRDADGDTPLHHCDAAPAAQFLLAHGADATLTDEEGNTVSLHCLLVMLFLGVVVSCV
jgi:ankyrin repeat protein